MTNDYRPNLKIALVHDDLTQLGGGERVFLAIKDLFPKAAIYTSMASSEWVERLGGRRPHTSFMQKLPLKKKLERAYFPLYPLAFESFNFSDYDLVISSSSRFAHGIITRPETTHICYMHSPGRQFWEAHQYFDHPARKGSRLGSLLSPMLSYLRLWDRAAAQRVDYFIANSKNTARRIRKYYGRAAEVVYPFVDLERFALRSADSEQLIANGKGKKAETTNYFLVVTRLVPWKRVDIAVKAINCLNTRMRGDSNGSNIRLIIVGDGPDRKRLEARSMNHESRGVGEVEFLGRVSDEELVELYRNCQALIMTQQEDFGITPLEAQAAGRPVIAYGAGGALETVLPGKTGEFFDEQTPEALAGVLRNFNPDDFDPADCRKQARRFSREAFEKNFMAQVERLVGNH